MRHVDASSREHQICVITKTTFKENLAILQDLHQAIVDIKQQFEISQDKQHELNNGLVYRKIKEKSFFYVPLSTENNVIANHNEVGHQRVNKTGYA